MGRIASPRRRTAWGALLVAAAFAATVGGSAPVGAQSGGGCALTGTARFKPGLGILPSTYAYSFSGSLSLCSSAPSGPTDGGASTGNVWTDPSTGFKWQEPPGIVSGTCASTTTSAVTITRWNDGTTTIIDYDTYSGLAAVYLTGTVAESVTLTAVDRQEGQPDSTTITTTRFAGGIVNGLLFAFTEFPEKCALGGLESVFLAGPTTLTVS